MLNIIKSLFLLVFLQASILLHAQVSPFNGDWFGEGDAMGSKLRITLHLQASGDSLVGTMDSPDQNVFGLEISSSSVDGVHMEIRVEAIRLFYQGELKEGRIDGSISQGPMVIPVLFGREELAAPVNLRPQDPTDYPYVVEEVSFINSEGGHTLAGTFTRPKGDQPVPCVVLISGSGPQDRNSEIANHRPFLVISDYLTRNGWGVLRYDDRGVAGSGGTFAGTVWQDLAMDAFAGVKYLATRSDVDPNNIGLVGHSEGGLIAPYLASNQVGIAFMVALAGPGTSGKQVILDQTQLILRASGYSSQELAVLDADQRKLLDIVEAYPDTTGLRAALRPVLDSMVWSMPEEEVEFYGGHQELIDIRLGELTDPWYQSFVKSDPTKDYARVHCPILAMCGELDLQVPAEANLNGIRRAVARAGNPALEVRSFPKLNHLFQPTETGNPEEYGKIDTTFSPEVLKVMLEWLNALP